MSINVGKVLEESGTVVEGKEDRVRKALVLGLLNLDGSNGQVTRMMNILDRL